MNGKLENIIEISQQANSDDIEIWTSNFKARGKLFKDQLKTFNGIVTLKDAKICSLFEECSCKETSIAYEWFNIFEDKIISFTVYK